MADLKGSKTAQNLKDAFAGESQANRRYLYFAQKADVEGYNDVSAVFRSTAEGETGHAHGHLEYLEAVGDPATGEPIGDTDAEPQGRDRRRDARIHRHVSGHGEDRARAKASTKSPTGSRRWPRPRRATPAASRRRSTRSASKTRHREWRVANERAAVRRSPFVSRHSLIRHFARHDNRGVTMSREGSLEAPTRHPIAWRDRGLLRRGRSSTPRCGASSTSVTAAGAASICAIPSRACST